MLILLLLGIYFPFSLEGYQPLCAVPRQFLFMVPLAVACITSFLAKEHTIQERTLLVLFSVLFLGTVITHSGNKWSWMVYGLMLLFFTVHFFISHRFVSLQRMAFCSILYLSILEPAVFRRNTWFRDMEALQQKLPEHSGCYYFPDHDNMMHWKLLHRFNDTTIQYYNLEKNPNISYRVYYQYPDRHTFHPGWFIFNKSYTTCSRMLIRSIDSLGRVGYFSRQLPTEHVNAYWIADKKQFELLSMIVSGAAVP